MFEEKQEEYQIPTQPTIKPIDNLEIQDFSLQIHLEPMTLEKEGLSRSETGIKMESEISLYDCWERQEPEDYDHQNSLKRRHRETRELGNNIRRSMLSKLDQMERAPTKRRHY